MITPGLRCPSGHPVSERAVRTLSGPVTRTDEHGRARTQVRVTGLRATCPTCQATETVMIPAPFVGRVVEVARAEPRGGEMRAKGRGR